MAAPQSVTVTNSISGETSTLTSIVEVDFQFARNVVQIFQSNGLVTTFPLSNITTVTYTIAGTAITIAIA